MNGTVDPENNLRKIETELGSIVGVDGGIDAMRSDLYSFLKAEQLPDFVQPLKVVEKGYRVVYEPAAILREEVLLESSSEYRMRVRVTLRSLWALKDMSTLIRGAGGVLFAWQLWSHKILRYFCFIFLSLALLSNIALSISSLGYFFILLAQLILYASALLSHILSIFGKEIRATRLIYYFALLNFASLHAAIKFLMGKKQIIWTPRTG